MAGRPTAQLQAEHETVPPITPAAYVLSWYAGVPALVGAVFCQPARRVPRLDPAALAWRRHAAGAGVATARRRALPGRSCPARRPVLCLPGDPAASHPDATPVADELVLAELLRVQVRAHADAFLARYSSAARLPRRALLGAFVDALDVNLWTVGEQAGDEAAAVRAAALVLPGRTPEFRE